MLGNLSWILIYRESHAGVAQPGSGIILLSFEGYNVIPSSFRCTTHPMLSEILTQLHGGIIHAIANSEQWTPAQDTAWNTPLM